MTLNQADLRALKDVVRPIHVQIGPGELFDRLSILRLKATRAVDPVLRSRAQAEVQLLEELAHASIPARSVLESLANQLTSLNIQLWQIENELRCCERSHDFGTRFVELARNVYRLNDERSRIKAEIDIALGYKSIEIKIYAQQQ